MYNFEITALRSQSSKDQEAVKQAKLSLKSLENNLQVIKKESETEVCTL